MAEIPESAYKISTPGRAATPGAMLDLLQDSGPFVVASNHFLVAVFKQAFTPVDGGRLMEVNCNRLETWLLTSTAFSCRTTDAGPSLVNEQS